jgi:hypothetical protein
MHNKYAIIIELVPMEALKDITGEDLHERMSELMSYISYH